MRRLSEYPIRLGGSYAAELQNPAGNTAWAVLEEFGFFKFFYHIK